MTGSRFIQLLRDQVGNEADPLGEQFLLWFLKEQVEQVGDGGESLDAPSAAGGAL